MTWEEALTFGAYFVVFVIAGLLFNYVLKGYSLLTSKAERNSLKYGPPSKVIGRKFMDGTGWEICNNEQESETTWKFTVTNKGRVAKEYFFVDVHYKGDNVFINVCLRKDDSEESKTKSFFIADNEIGAGLRDMLINLQRSHLDFISAKNT